MKNRLYNPGYLAQSKRRSLLARLLSLAAALAVALSAVLPALAWTGQISARQAVEDDLFLFGDIPPISERVQGNVFALGRDVRLEGEVEGSLFVLTDQLSLDGRVAGSVYAAALTMRQNAGSEVGQSIYAATLNLVTEREAAIARDLRTVAISANLRGTVGRDTQAKIGLLELWRALQRGVTGGITGLPLPALADVLQPARWAGYTFAGLPALLVDRSLVFPAPALQTVAKAPGPWLENLKALLALLLIGGLALWLFPGAFARIERQAHRHPLASTGAGAVILLNGFLMPALITILVGSAYFGLIFLTVPDLAWMLLGVGFGGLVTVFSLFLLASAYLSKALIASMVGSLILRRFLPRFASVRFLPLLLGLLIYVALASLPYLGFTIGLLVTMMGLGAMWLARRPELPSPAAEAEAIPQPAPAAEPAGAL